MENNQDNQFNRDDNQNPISGSEFPRIHPVAAGMIGIVGSFFLYQIVGGLMTLLIIGIDINSAPVPSVRMLTIATQMLFILLPSIILAKGIYGSVESTLRIKLPDIKELLMFFVGFVVLMLLLQNFLYIQNAFIAYLAEGNSFINSAKQIFDQLDKMVNDAYKSILSSTNILDLVFVIIVVAVTPAFCEEFLYRGFVQKSFEYKIKPVFAALLTAFFFSVSHFSPYGLIALMALGFYFGYAVYKTGSIFTSVLLHFFNNFTSVVLFYVFRNDDMINAGVVKREELNQAFIAFAVLLVVFIGIMYYIFMYYKKKDFELKQIGG